MKKTAILILTIAIFTGAYYIVNNYTKHTKDKTVRKFSNETKSNSSWINPSSLKKKAIDFELEDINGNKISLEQLKGKKVFLNFWATWCPPCRLEMPELEKLYQETKDTDLVILAIDLGEDQETVKSFIKQNNYNFTVLLDSVQEVADNYKINSIPTSFFIDEDGYIVNRKIGAMTYEEMKSYVDLFDK